MEATTIQKFMHTSPRKLRLVADMVRKMPPSRALEALSITRKDAALDLLKSISSALANAKQKGIAAEVVTFKSIEINEGPKMKRFRASTRGRAKPYVKKMSHIKIVLTDEVVSVKPEKVKAVTKETAKTEKKEAK